MDTQPTSIRRFRKNDIAAYALARRKLWPNHGIKEFRRELNGLLKTRHFFSWLAIDSEGKIIGFLEASMRPYANGCRFSPVLFLEGIWVDDRFRKQGIGDLLLKNLEAFARKKKLREIGSDCLFSNKLSVAIHRKWKFKETMRVVYFRKEINHKSRVRLALIETKTRP
jgi:aminoglycoside 6'-N-acetyltransferase I